MSAAVAPWAADYVGIPWRPFGRDRAGVDCWGLLRLVYAERFGIALPSYAGDYADPADRPAVEQLIGRHREGWRPGRDRPGAAVLFRIAGHDCHVGIAVGGCAFLHIERHTDAALGRFDSGRWARRQPRFFEWGAG